MKLKPFKFRRRANRLCIWPEGMPPVPVAVAGLDEYRCLRRRRLGVEAPTRSRMSTTSEFSCAG